VLLQKIEFEPASKGFSYQLENLKTKYVILNPKNDGAAAQRPSEPAQIKRQSKIRPVAHCFSTSQGFLLLLMTIYYFKSDL